ncbi:MAG: hypothetical protein QXT73_00840 [Candidatus Methanomethylicaceae archaeon]
MVFTITAGGILQDLRECELFWGVKKSKEDVNYVILKGDTEFNKAAADKGKVSIFLSETDLDLPAGLYVGELRATFNDGTISKSQDVIIEIDAAVT